MEKLELENEQITEKLELENPPIEKKGFHYELVIDDDIIRPKRKKRKDWSGKIYFFICLIVFISSTFFLLEVIFNRQSAENRFGFIKEKYNVLTNKPIIEQVQPIQIIIPIEPVITRIEQKPQQSKQQPIKRNEPQEVFYKDKDGVWRNKRINDEIPHIPQKVQNTLKGDDYYKDADGVWRSVSEFCKSNMSTQFCKERMKIVSIPAR